MPAKNDRSVLVVDDDPDLLDLMAYVLSANGFTVRTASNGKEALAEVERDMPAVILLDMKMPVMNGWEFSSEFHRLHDAAAPIVVVTAADDGARRASEAGAAGWIGKPFDVGRLVQVVQQYVPA